PRSSTSTAAECRLGLSWVVLLLSEDALDPIGDRSLAGIELGFEGSRERDRHERCAQTLRRGVEFAEELLIDDLTHLGRNAEGLGRGMDHESPASLADRFQDGLPIKRDDRA